MITPQPSIPPPIAGMAARPEAAPDEQQQGAGGYSVRIEADIATISDRGTAADVVSMGVAEQLAREQIIDKIHPPKQEMMIQFGIQSARSRVIGEIHGAGLIGTMYVVSDELPTVLISDITFTTKGVILVQDDVVLIGVAGDRVVLEGVRDNSLPRSHAKALWRLDLRKLLREEDPRKRAQYNEEQLNASAVEIVRRLVHQQQEAGGGPVVMSTFGAKPTYRIADIRQGRRAVKNFGGLSSLTIAKTIERGALKNVANGMTPALFRALSQAKGNIPQLIATARKQSSGGTGIRSTVVGEIVAFDDVGRFLPSTFGIQFAAIFRDEASSYVMPYGLQAKTDLVEALRMWCQFVESCGKGPVRGARCDATSMVSRVDGDLTVEFRAACAELHLAVQPSAPEDQATNPEERGYQTISHRMAALMLQQNNLKKDNWWLFLIAACVYDTVVCHRDETRTPCELMRSIKPCYEHITEFFPGQLAMCPRVGGKKLLDSNFQLCVAICPVLHNNAWVVLLEGGSQPQIRSRLQPVGVELSDLTAKEALRLQPTFDESGRLTQFHSRATANFTLKNKMKAYEEGEDLLEQEQVDRAREDIGSVLDEKRMLQPVPRRSSRVAAAQSQQATSAAPARTGSSIAAREPLSVLPERAVATETGERTELTSGEAEEAFNIREGGCGPAVEDSVEEQYDSPLNVANTARLLQTVDNFVLHMAKAGSVPRVEDLASNHHGGAAPQVLIIANKARTVHTEKNPTATMLERDPRLAEVWKESTEKEISGSIMNGSRMLISEEEKAEMGFIEYPLIFAYSTKRDGTRKCRAATDGRAEAVEWFNPDDLFAEGVLPMFVKLVTAFGVYFRMVDMSTDVAQCFTRHNKWQDAQVQRRICHRLSAYQSPTGQPALIADLTLNYGLRDGPGHWRRYSDRVLIESCGMTRSRIVNQIFYKFRGEKGLLVLCKITDDFKVVHSDDEDGYFMKTELLEVLQKEKEMELTINIPTNDYSSLFHRFEEPVQGGEGRTVTLHQPTQIRKVAQHFFGEDLSDVPETYCPFDPQWSAAASIQCPVAMSAVEFMSGLGKISWTSQTRMESPFPSLLACRGQSPSALDGEALKHYAAYLWTTREVGITFHPGPVGCDIRTPMPIHVYADSGQNSHPDGAAQIGLAFYVGEQGHPGGAFYVHSQKADGVVGESVPVDECMALVKAAKLAVCFRHLLEELAGLTRDDVDTSEMLLDGSSPPTPCSVSDRVATVMTHRRPGHLGAAAADAAAHLVATGQPPPVASTVILQDNAGVVNNILHVSAKSKGLMRITRVVSFLQGLYASGIITPEKVAAREMKADLLTKQINAPTEHWRKASLLLGIHPDVTALVEKVERKFNKRSGEANFQRESESSGDRESVCSANAAVAQKVDWVQSTSLGVRHMLRVLGLYDEGSDHRPLERQQVLRAATATTRTEEHNVDGERQTPAITVRSLPLPEQLRVALAKLTPEERLLFSTRLRGTEYETPQERLRSSERFSQETLGQKRKNGKNFGSSWGAKKERRSDP